MTIGLKIRQNDIVTFDSSLAAGGVCLGIFTVASGGSNFDFPEFPSAQGIALVTGSAGIAFVYSVNYVPGYLRFVFPGICAGQTVALFAK